MKAIKKDNTNLEDILEYINNNYEIEAKIINKFDEQVIEVINKECRTPSNWFYFEICPDWGFAPGKMLICYEHEDRSHGLDHYYGCSGANVYEGIKNIERFMENCNVPKRNQISIFDFEGV